MDVSPSLLLLAGLVGALGTGCTVHGRVHHGYHVVWAEPPPLVYVDGVYVVHDSDVAVYYVDGGYWYCDGGVWYHRTHHHHDWVVVHHHDHVPNVIIHRNHHTYVHAKGNGDVYRAPAEPHKKAKPTLVSSSSGGHARASASVQAGADDRRRVEPARSESSAKRRELDDSSGSVDRSEPVTRRVESSEAEAPKLSKKSRPEEEAPEHKTSSAQEKGAQKASSQTQRASAPGKTSSSSSASNGRTVKKTKVKKKPKRR